MTKEINFERLGFFGAVVIFGIIILTLIKLAINVYS